MNPTTPQMPMAQSAAKLSLDDQLMPDLNIGTGHARAPLSLGAPSTPPPAMPSPPPGGAPMPQTPAPAGPPWDVQLQGDGSSVYTVPGPDGKPIVLSVNPAPKLPKALQPSVPKTA